MEKNILGLDLGTNSIGWALIKQDFKNKKGEILGLGSRIIPMSQDIMGDFGKGNSISQTAERTAYRGVRRLRERFLLRRQRLHRVLNTIDFLPKHFAEKLDFEKRLGQFKDNSEPKIAYDDNGFIFKNAFNEMCLNFKKHQPELFINEIGEDKSIPHDWTIYYLRKKALTQKIEKEELSWILLNFNQKRGYYQLRGEEEEENPNKLVEFYSLKIVDVTADEPQKGKDDIWYSLVLENGWVYRRASKTPLFDWKEKTKDFIVTTDINDDGSVKTNKDGEEKRSFRAPKEDDWTLIKKKTENEIEQSEKTVGTYIFDTLLLNPKLKIKGKLIRTIERKFYKSELRRILEKQVKFYPELQNKSLYSDCIRELYRNNEAHQITLSKKDLLHLLIDDIIFYQRPLKSQKSTVSNCSFEYRVFKDKNGAEHQKYLKAIPKSNPYYQEFRIWQWMFNLNIYTVNEENVTTEFLNSADDWENLFEFLNSRKEIDQKALLKYFKLKENTHRWNYVKDKKYPGNETRTLFITRLAKVDNIEKDFLTREIEQMLWHLTYSVSDKIDYEKALKTFANKNNLDEKSFFEAFKKFQPFKSDYGSFSEKAIKKLLPLMRVGKYWTWENIHQHSKERILKILNGEVDENIKDRVREKVILLKQESDFKGLQLWLAQYIVYDRHSEASSLTKWTSVQDLDNYLQDFKQHSLRNPIVEQVVTETLRVVKDIWNKYGNGAKGFFTEIHVELGRDMKNTAEDRKRITESVTENENTNLRIKALLAEMTNDANVKNVRSYSPMQQDILKIYEEGVLNSDIEITDEILKISKTAQPSSSELKRYKLWLEQKYKSPYTGEIIPLNKLFTAEYEIEHIIPQSRFFDDSYSNKVICESAINKLKDNFLGLPFIKEFHGTIVDCGMGKTVNIFEVEQYEDFVQKHYAKNRGKRNKLLLEEIPEKMVERQINDTRYISKFITQLLSSIVRAENNDDGVNSKNVIPGNGKITNALKQDWGLNDVWNEMILPRFKRMNEITNTTDYTAWNKNHQKFLPTVPLEQSKGFSKKRIDHRHHAVDALIVACATREHVNYMNNEHALKKNKSNDEKQKLRFDLRANICEKKYNDSSEKNYNWIFVKPWDNFTIDTKKHLEKIVISFKQNLRIINKATNYYEKYVIKDGVKTKEVVEQKGVNWAIRKPMHKETVSGKIDLPWMKVPKGKILTATRKNIDSTFNLKTIQSITDTGIQKILRKYLKFKNDDSELAFSPEGIEDMNKNIEKYNDGKKHQPIYKVRIFETGSKFQVGQTGNKIDKYVEAAKGTNLFFAIYQDENGKRNYETIPLNEVIERQKQNLPSVPSENEKGHQLVFSLSPNDLVYVPNREEQEYPDLIDFKSLKKDQVLRIYKVEKTSGVECYFIRQDIALLIKNYDAKTKVGELESQNKLQTTMTKDRQKIADVCIKLTVDRIGNITKF